MNNKINILLVLLLLFISVGAVSAVEDLNDTISSDEAIIEEISPNTEELSSINDQEVLTTNSHTITKENYSRYFSPKGELVSSDVKDGDTIYLQGEFVNANFIFKKHVNIVGIDNVMRKSTVTLYSGASGSTILNLNIDNAQQYA